MLQNKDLTSIEEAREEILSKSLKGPYKVIRTTDKLNAIIKYINESQPNVFMPEYNEDDIFECDSTFLVDVTLEVSK